MSRDDTIIEIYDALKYEPEAERYAAAIQEIIEDLHVARQSLYKVVAQRNELAVRDKESRNQLQDANDRLDAIWEVCQNVCGPLHQNLKDDTERLRMLKTAVMNICRHGKE